MDKTFEDIISETLEEFKTDNAETDNTNQLDNGSESAQESEESQEGLESTNTNEEDSETDDIIEDNASEKNSDDELENLDEEVETPGVNEKDAQAFARMRTQLKEANNNLAAAKNIIDFFDVRAKQMGLDGIKGLIEKTREAELSKQAEKEGIPVDVLKRLEELETKVQMQDEEKEMLQRSQKEQSINYTFDKFMQKHSLGKDKVNDLAKSLIDDGFSLNNLMNMPESAVSRILESYLPKEALRQEAIAKKEQIKKELPVSGKTSSKLDTDSEIDKIAKLWAKGY